MIAFVAEDAGQMDLFVARVAGGGRIRLTNDKVREASPAFSPDGERIAFTRSGSETGPSRVEIIPALGGEPAPLIASAAEPAWSPDGRRLAVIMRVPGEGEALATLSADGTDVRQILRSDGNYPFFRSAAWSPDGRQIAVVRSTGGLAGEIWMISASGGSTRRLTKDEGGVYSDHPVFTPDGKGLVHQSNRGGAANLWLLPLSGGPSVRLTTGPGPDGSPSVSKNGSIAFVSSRARTDLLLCSLTGGETRRLVSHSSYLWSPSFSPNGQELAFSQAEENGAWHVWTVALAGGPPRRITNGDLPEIWPQYTPDGAWIIFHTWSPGPDRVWRVPSAGGPPLALTPARDEDDGYADISPDGRWLAFARTEQSVTRIYVESFEGGQVRRLLDSPSTLPRWSPDGRLIAFSRGRSTSDGVYIVGQDGTGLRMLTDSGCWPVWWPDGKAVAYLTRGPDGNQRLCMKPLTGGPAQFLPGPQFRGTNYPMAISPDGRYLATTNTTPFSSEIWLLEP
jgi:TolB protein